MSSVEAGLLLLLVFLDWPAPLLSLLDPNTKCECGQGSEGETDAVTSAPVKFVSMNQMMKRKKSRIVNGYEPKRRPWMVLLEMLRTIPRRGKIPRNNPQCGGALINKLWVVTAAHCFCMKPLKCKKDPSAVDFSLKQVNIYLSQHDISRKRRVRENFFKPRKIIIHPKYVRNERDQNDIALLKLRREATFNAQRSPICLPPPDPDFQDTDLPEVFVAGWGLLSDMKCTTDDGPAPFKRCKFPFKWHGQTHSGCTYTNTPSYENPECESFKERQEEKKITYEQDYAGLEIISADNTTKTICFDESPRNYGWCGTCESSASKGEDGYCGNDRSPAEPTFTQKWGWCSSFCASRTLSKRRTSILQEVQLSTLTKAECARYGKTMKAVPSIELCAGLKEKKRMLKTFLQDEEGYVLQEKKQEGNASDFFLGGKDSCKGDSGGPLFLWQDDAAILIGVVSRGKGCAGFNEAGIYTRITKKLDWIMEYVEDGNC